MTKSAHYFYDGDAIKEKIKPSSLKRAAAGVLEKGSRNCRDVWFIPIQPTKEAHFATFPERLVSPCIKAGTSEYGVCAKCGAQYERLVKKDATTMNIRVRDAKHDRLDKKSGGKASQEEIDNYGEEIIGNIQTIGWRPTCDCGAEITKAVVLDPFMGSGTVALVAKKLNRNYIGIELNSEYIKIAERRIAKLPPRLEI